jgi:hydrogenase-1 operon protein HyaF
MSRLHEIPVVVVHDRAGKPCPAEAAPSMVLALIKEIEAKLEVLAKDGEDSTIDLRWLIGLPRDLELLRENLGEGEVSATVTSIGSTLVQETGLPCVWWISHRDNDGRRLGEFVEITEIPEILRSDHLSIPSGLAELQSRYAQLDTPESFSSNSPPRGNLS